MAHNDQPRAVLIYLLCFNVRATYASIHELHADLGFEDIHNSLVVRVFGSLLAILSCDLYATRRVSLRGLLRSLGLSDIEAIRDLSPYNYGRSQRCQQVDSVWAGSCSWSIHSIGVTTSFYCICKHDFRFNVYPSLIAGHQGG